MQTILSIVISTVLSVSSILGLSHYTAATLSPQMQQAMQEYLHDNASFGNTQPFAGNTYNLAGAGVSSSATSISLTSLTIKQTGQPILTADLVGSNGGTFYVTIEPGSNSKQEIVGCTGVSQNSTSATLTGCSRGLSPIYPYTASSTLQFTHGGGSIVIFSDPPQLFNQYGALANDQAWTGTNTFSPTSKPAYSSNPTFGASDGNAFVNYSTLTATAIAGAGTSTEGSMGISQLATQAQTALGTASSTTGAPLVVKNAVATSTYNACCTAAGNVPVLRSQKTIDPNFIATSSADSYNFGGPVSFIATSSNIATSTFGGVSGSAIQIHGINYTYSAATAATGSVMTNDGTNFLYPAVPSGYILVTAASTTVNAQTYIQATSSISYRHYKVFLDELGMNSGAAPVLNFNNDYGTNYGDRLSLNGGTQQADNVKTGINIFTSVGTTSPALYEFEISNPTTQRKNVIISGSMSDATNISPSIITGVGVWNNISAGIVNFTITPGGGVTWTVGTNLTIFGSNN